jgi:CubicO group peptidase (beta-lactamase class C family)
MRILFLIILLSLFWSCEENQIGTLEKTSYKVNFVKPLSSFGSLKDSLENSGRYNALSVAIIRSDTTVTWDYGLANDSSLFRVGSVSKSFTGLSILKLVEQGKVSLNDTLIKLIPELPFSNKFDEPILLKHVLEASAGFVSYRKEDFTSDPGYDTISISKLLLNNPYNFEPSWPPGKYTAYHTVGPFITGYIIEDRSNMRYNDFVSSHFFKPLDMSRSTFFENDEVKNHLINYQDSTFLHLKQRSSGSLITSTRELIPFLQMLIDDGTYDGRQILTRESIDRFETATSNLAVNKLDISDGHGINSWSMYYDGIRYQTHPGEIAPRFLAQYGYSRKYRTGFIFMIQGASQGALKVLNRTILPYLEPQIEKPPTNKISVKEENEYLGCYEKIQKTWLTDPAFSIELIRDSADQLAIRNNNFDDSPHIKPLKHTSRKSIYLDDNPKNNFSINGQTRYALVTDENGEKVIQKISYPWEAYKRIPCDKK